MIDITIEHNPSPAKLDVMGVYDWPLWQKEPSEFPWTYEQSETCYFLSGRVTVVPDGGDAVEMGEGDLVSFPVGLSCTWTVHEAVSKHYLLK